MGVVYLVRDLDGRLVAIKVLRSARRRGAQRQAPPGA